ENQEWLRWERWLNLDNSRAAAYPGSHQTVSYTSGTYRIGYVGTGYDPSVTPFPGPNDPEVNAPAATPHGVDTIPPAVPNITASRDNTGSNGSQGQPIRVQRDVTPVGGSPELNSYAGWTEPKADLGGYTFQAIVNSMSNAELQAVRALYGYPLLASTGASVVENERFSAWKGNRDDPATAFGMVTGTPAYFDIRPKSGGQDPIYNNSGVTSYTCTRVCRTLASGAGGASGPI